MRKNQIRLAFLLSVGLLTLGVVSVGEAQTKPTEQNTMPAKRSPDRVAGIIESVDSASIKVRLADGSIKSYPRNQQIFSTIKPAEGIAIILDKDVEVGVSRGGRPLQVFDGRIVDLKNDRLSVMLTSGQVKNIAISPEFASQLKNLQRTTDAPSRLPITGIVNDLSPLSSINYTPSTPTNLPTAQMTRRIAQGSNVKAKYSDLILACQGRKVEVDKLKALQDVANNVVRFERLEVVDINDVLKGQEIKAFQQRHAQHTPTEDLILNNALKEVSVAIANNNDIMTLEQALLLHKVNKKSIIGIKVPDDIYYSKVFVFYDSTLN